MGPWGPSESAVNLPANNSGYDGTSAYRYLFRSFLLSVEEETESIFLLYYGVAGPKRTHDDSIWDAEAVNKYAEYQLEFRRQHLRYVQ